MTLTARLTLTLGLTPTPGHTPAPTPLINTKQHHWVQTGEWCKLNFSSESGQWTTAFHISSCFKSWRQKVELKMRWNKQNNSYNWEARDNDEDEWCSYSCLTSTEWVEWTRQVLLSSVSLYFDISTHDSHFKHGKQVDNNIILIINKMICNLFYFWQSIFFNFKCCQRIAAHTFWNFSEVVLIIVILDDCHGCNKRCEDTNNSFETMIINLLCDISN